MAIPIRLTMANGNDQIDLIAQSLDMSVNRNVSAFPTPNNLLQRFAVDTNIPSIKIDINGIFVDDEGLVVEGSNNVTLDANPMRSMINFGALLPTEPNSFNAFKGVGAVSSFEFVANTTDVPKSQSNTVNLVAPAGTNLEHASKATEEIDVRPATKFKTSTSYSSGFTQITLIYSFPVFTFPAYILIAENFFNIGDRLVKEDGSLIGIIQSISNNTITFTTSSSVALASGEEIFLSLRVFNHMGEEVGYADYLIDDPAVDDGDTALYTLGLTAVNEALIRQGMRVTLNSQNSALQHFKFQTIKIIPSYWLENPPFTGLLYDTVMHIGSQHSPVDTNLPSENIPRAGIRLQFDFTRQWNGLTNFGVTVSSGSNPSLLRPGGLSRMGLTNDVASADAVINVPVKDIDLANNPALAMATLVKSAFEISGDVIDLVTTGFNPAGGKTLSDAFTVQQNGVMLSFIQSYNPATEIEHPSLLSKNLRQLFSGVEFQSRNSPKSQAKKSAGDKVQDLIGVVSNANRNNDLLRGIQIPYDSLVTSTVITGVARNFFTTFGEIIPTEKGSEFNTRSASKNMQNLLLGMSDGGSGDESPDSWYDKFIEPLIPNEIESIFGFLVGAGQQLWITLTDKSPSGNAGGIRIIPEKLHVRYDAGNNYYAFNLELMASDYVIGV